MHIYWENILITIISFILLYFLLQKYAFNKLFSIMEQRRELVMNQLAEAANSKKAASDYVEEQRKALEQARLEAQGIIETSRQTSSAQADMMLEQAKEESLRIKDEALRDIESEKNKAVAALRGEVGRVSVQIASKLLEKEIDEKSNEGLVDQYLKDVGSKS
ncbi:F0F1 ATP synthase subunit B [Saccharibacillus kuerlensis]|uniref:ATP synthase subunit b n=1 Tax=Saccharibacillus kuerlensis TaxID=459527 RepID=A0ABQ2KUQ1_9BACL|nr:F0F1 ATP synthase subunit B [Saccharibacillus kuerlensis]GGN93346.1 ATP synthase subunit b [Saccharibacillus kuerlensis]